MKLTITRCTQDPVGAIAEAASICWDSISNDKICDHVIKCGHNRTLEFADITVIVEGASAKLVREIYTHIHSSKLQSSTRYIDYKNFNYIIPISIANNKNAINIYECYMETVRSTHEVLLELGIPKEDASFVLPLAYESKMILKINFSSLLNMSKKRMCNRAFWEFRSFMKTLIQELNKIEGWNHLTRYLKPQCDWLGYCPEETSSCGRKENKIC